MGKERKSRAYTAVAAYVRALRWCRFIVIGFWLAVLGTGVKYAFNLLDKVYTNDIPSDLPVSLHGMRLPFHLRVQPYVL